MHKRLLSVLYRRNVTLMKKHGKNLKGFLIFEDEEGILRLKSILINDEESKDFISPIILPSKHLAVRRFIAQEHLVNNHAGALTLLTILRERFWIVKGKRTVRRKDGIIRLAKLRTEKGNILRPIQRLYPMELTPNYVQVVPETQKVPEVVTEYPEINTDSNETVPVSRSGREIKPVKRLDL
ncbi:uncharacterized protein CEXT_565251 [Caerostris extrusa]|uniref:Integrase zinc-binding domain-containing protein n=1 Tax=Caerostris extrusa TaxID=172846 RepID=A0AAV4TN66_CAEEX|nr:uncharacterized protein CEXT_565251 [Caerostris extrusa]